MGPDGETLLDPLPTATAVLAGIGGRHRNHSTASICCFAFEDGPKLRPARIADAFGEVRILDQVGHPQVFQIDGVVGSHQGERRLVVKVPPLPLDLLVLLGEPSRTAFLRRLLPFFRRETRRWALASAFSALR